MKHLFSLIFLFFFLFSEGQPPSGYYNSAQNLTGTELQAALHLIIDNHTVVSYSSLFTHFQNTDKKPDGPVWDMYSDVPGGTPPYIYNFNAGDQCGNYSGEGDCFNREHSWPKSWFNDQSPMNSDIFHIYPTDGYVNGRRSNYPFGEVSSATWASQNGSRLGNCSYPGYSGIVFEPIDEFKGDFARTYFYMSTRYYNEDSGWEGSDQVIGSQLKPWALAMMKKWHLDDPVSDKEIERNNAVFAIQHNRNPFIDHPEYVSYIWGGTSSVNDHEINSNIKIYPVPAVDFCIIDHKGYYDLGKITISLSDVTGRQYIVNYSESENTINVNSSLLSSGFYLITITENGKKPAFARLVK